MTLSAKKAADQVGISKQALINAIRKGKISAEKDHNGEWQIDPSELFRAYPPVNQLDDNQTPSLDDTLQSSLSHVDSGLRVEVATLRERLGNLETERTREREQLTGQIEDLRRRLDSADEERRRLTAILTDQRPTPKRPFWHWLTGRS